MSNLSPAPVVIVGGGIGGLATALSLASRGRRVHVLERAPEFAEIGAGIEHVGLGSDVDLAGRDSAKHSKRKNDLDGIDYSKKIYDLTEGLLRRNYCADDIALILGGNFQRALAAIWA